MGLDMTKNFDDAKKCWVYAPVGDIDIHNSQDFQSRILADFREKPASVVIDARELRYIDSTALGAFIAVYKVLSEAGYVLAFENVRKFVLKLFRITDMDKLFEIRSESDE